MSHSERRIQRVAVAIAVVALGIAIAAVIVRWRSDVRPGAPPRRHVAASDLVRLKPGAIVQAEGGIRVSDPQLASALGVQPGDTITAISGRSVARLHELSGVLHDLAALRPQSLFVDLLRDHQGVLERWELDGDLDVARRADLAAGAEGRDARIASVQQVGRTAFRVPRATVEAWTADPAQVTSGGRAIPMLDAGDQRGFKIYAIRPGSAYAALGLEDGDVVRAINGTQLASPEQALELVARAGPQITLDVVRRGESIMLNYLIK